MEQTCMVDEKIKTMEATHKANGVDTLVKVVRDKYVTEKME